MSLIRRGFGSQLYIYETGCDGTTSYVCSDCPRDIANRYFDTKDQLKEHILDHKQRGETIGLVGHPLTYQSYDELLDAVDADDF